jgi:hypothetical protein
MFAKLLLLTAPVYGLLMALVAGGGDSLGELNRVLRLRALA